MKVILNIFKSRRAQRGEVLAPEARVGMFSICCTDCETGRLTMMLHTHS